MPSVLPLAWFSHPRLAAFVYPLCISVLPCQNIHHHCKLCLNAYELVLEMCRTGLRDSLLLPPSFRIIVTLTFILDPHHYLRQRRALRHGGRV